VWRALILFDFPFSIIFSALMFHSVHPMISFGIFGTLWWYFLSWVALSVYSQIRRRP
jgi:hypothetical protein